jgi:pimeloyl-ACP methyl ester carboxylesterase
MGRAPRRVLIHVDGRDLVGHLISAGHRVTPRPGILFLHGLHSDQRGYLRRAEIASRRLGATCLTVDLSGHGESVAALDRLSLRDHLADALAAYDVLASSAHVEPTRMGVCGASYGGYLAAAMTTRRPVGRLLLRAPALYADDDFDTSLADRATGVAPAAAGALLRSLARFDGEVLVVESERDEVVPHATIEAYADAFPHAHATVIPEATHALTDPAWEATFVGLVLSWFREL